MCNHRSDRRNNQVKDLRELTFLEYQHLWPELHKKPKRFEVFLKAYNSVQDNREDQIYFTTGNRGFIPLTTVYRETLPKHFQDKLDAYEKTLEVPFVGGFYKLVKGRKNVIEGNFRPHPGLVELSNKKYED